MAVILNIETSTDSCSVALFQDEKCIFNKEEHRGPQHAVLLPLFVEEALKILREKEIKIEAVAVSSGPGSYTGLRIGVSTVKGLAYGLQCPLIAVGTLDILANSITVASNSFVCPMIDARRMEVYTGMYRDGELVTEVSASIIDENSYADMLKDEDIYFVGNGSEKCRKYIQNSKAHFVSGIIPLAINMNALAQKKYQQKIFEDVAYFEPFYLKDFIATTPKNKGLL